MGLGRNNFDRISDYEAATRDFPQAKRALCFGDSWFQYVPHPTDLDKQLARLFRGTLFLNEGVAGRDSAMWKSAIPRVEREIASYRFDAILLSNGGNDVVGSEMKEFIKTAGQLQSPGSTRWGEIPREVFDHVRLETFEHALRYAILDLKQIVDIVNQYSRESLVFVHTYDYVWPSGKGFKLGLVKTGPWIKPYLDEVGLTDPAGQRVLTSWLVDQFARELKAFVSVNAANVRLIDSRGTLPRQAQWENEIHPTARGFELIATQCWKPALAAVLR
ncbi:hypothetical protein [Dokdonella sp.]|uniref:hypothetical protein n=1 Tax=Dokdonella sp. TaxID=2291710 RepID=UPI001B0D5AE8|nr:hypothetical protein [Dokdonella sp.]MBO9663601.1 hypothetical protein [Dokdonella sp.]